MKKYLLTLLILMFGMQVFSNGNLSNVGIVNEKQPTRIEKKEFEGISSISLIQKYGNVIIQESSSNKVSLEIQYFDSGRRLAECSISKEGNQLIIKTTNSGGRNNDLKVVYILVIPKKTNISGTLSYGNMKIGEYSGLFNYVLEYANLSANSFIQKPLIKAMYSNITIDMCDNMLIEGSYNKYIIKKARNLSLPNMRYSNAEIDFLQTFEGDLSYSSITIKDVKSSLVSKLSYSSIKMKSLSNIISNIKIDGSYSDINVNLPQDIQAKVSFTVFHGGVYVSEYLKTTYVLDSKEKFVEEKIGRIGTKNPSLNMNISNKYADINIQTIK